MDNRYDFKKIGERIKSEREKAGYSLTKFEELVNVSRQTISKWEKAEGSSSPTLDDFLRMCNIFNCELGYLLCEYDCKTRAATDIHKETGLSEKAINTLRGREGYSLGETATALEARVGRPVDLSTVQARFLSRLIEDNNGKTLERIAYGALSIFNNSSFDLNLDTIEMDGIRDKIKSEKLSITQDFLNFIDRCTITGEPAAPEAIR